MEIQIVLLEKNEKCQLLYDFDTVLQTLRINVRDSRMRYMDILLSDNHLN